MESEILEQRQEITNLQSEIKQKDLELQNQADTRRELENRLAREERINESLNTIRGRINSATDEEDGPIAPVLRDALNSLDGLSDSGESHNSDSGT